jgi:hypothetical protein
MKGTLGALSLAMLITTTTAAANGTVERTFSAPMERVWGATEAVLKHQGWDIDKADRAFGLITTDSRRLDGENYGVYEKALRHRLRLQVKAAAENRTTVSIERAVFKRERILFVDKDEPITDPNQAVEKAVLDAIAKAL